jgi:hypothetical protein
LVRTTTIGDDEQPADWVAVRIAGTHAKEENSLFVLSFPCLLDPRGCSPCSILRNGDRRGRRTEEIVQPRRVSSVQNLREAERASYRFSPALPGGRAELAYFAPTTERPYNYYNYMYEPPAGSARENCEYRVSPTWIADARTMAAPPRIHLEGFELWDAPTTVVDFSDEDRFEGATTPKRPSSQNASPAPTTHIFFIAEQTDRARAKGTFGAPTFFVGTEIPGAMIAWTTLFGMRPKL